MPLFIGFSHITKTRIWLKPMKKQTSFTRRLKAAASDVMTLPLCSIKFLNVQESDTTDGDSSN